MNAVKKNIRAKKSVFCGPTPNPRMLAEWNPLFYSLPLESVIHDHQQAYYDALSGEDQASDSTGFVTFMLETIKLLFLCL